MTMETSVDVSADLIGPLTVHEWCEFRVRDDNPDADLLYCCSVTSEVRDAVFDLLRNGGARHMRGTFAYAYAELLDHGLPDGRAGELLARLRDYYLPGLSGDEIKARVARARETWAQLTAHPEDGDSDEQRTPCRTLLRGCGHVPASEARGHHPAHAVPGDLHARR